MRGEKEITYEILNSIRNSEEAVGATTLYTLYGKVWNMSQATIGRKLMEFDYNGYTVLKGRQGRVLTDKGEHYLNRIERELRSQNRHDILIQELGKTEKSSLLDALFARKVIERALIDIAANKITDEDIITLEEILQQQQTEVENSNYNDEADQQFHLRIASIADNKVLYLCLGWLYEATPYMDTTSYIRKSVGSTLVVDHQQILECLKRRDGRAAQEAMETHINQIMQDVEKLEDIN